MSGRLILDLLPCADAFTQERALLAPAVGARAGQRVRLVQPMRDGDEVLYPPCRLPERPRPRRRRRIEAAFLNLTNKLCCEVDTLAQPDAVLRAAHCVEVTVSLMRYHLELERAGLEVAVEARASLGGFTTHCLAAMAAWLLGTAAKTDLRRYKKPGASRRKRLSNSRTIRSDRRWLLRACWRRIRDGQHMRRTSGNAMAVY